MFKLGIGLLAFATLSAGAQQPAMPDCAGSLTAADLDHRVDALIDKMTPAERIGQLQDRAPAIPRLGIPAYNWWNEGLHGIARNGYATVFPQAIGMAATWDADLLQKVGDVVSTEARAKFNGHQNSDSERYAGLTIWSPNINIFRDPRWGRGQETYGEDPYLTGLLGSRFVAGIQGDRADHASDFYRKADATPKHFAVHSGPESLRDAFDARVSAHDLEDTYTPAFRALTSKDGAHSAAIMCSYNRINGIPACANPLLQQRLRDQWGFGGYVVSDCDAVGNITEYHHYTVDDAHGAAAALKAGTDLDCGTTYAHLAEALDKKLVTLADIDRSLHRLLLERLRLGMLQPASCSPWSAISAKEVDTPADRALALRAAEESMVLLKNEKHTLPMEFQGKRVAVIGPTADMLQVIEANYHGTVRNPKTLLDGLKDVLADGAKITYAQGSMLAEGATQPISRGALRVSDGAAAEGLTAEYFANADLTGRPLRTRVDSIVNFDLDRAVPVPGLGKQYSIRWSGMITPPAPGKYRLHVGIDRCWDCTLHDSYRLWIDGSVVAEDSGTGGDKQSSVSVDWTESGTGSRTGSATAASHTIRLELRHTGDDEGIRLDWEAPAAAQLAEAVAVAQKADVVLAIVGLSPDLEGEAMPVKIPGFDGGDRVTLGLPEPQKRLLTELGKLGKPMVVVVTSGSAVSLGDETKGAQAILEAWYPGEEGGHALGRLLKGDSNPSGRLPVTVYRSEADLPAFTDYSMAHRTYRYFDGPVLYPFGFGLSYSDFTYSEPKVVGVTPDGPRELVSTVTNVSGRDGDAVAELYLIPPMMEEGAPLVMLRGLQRVHLKAGESREVHFVSPSYSLVDENGKRSVSHRKYHLFVGGELPANLGRSGPQARNKDRFPNAGSDPDGIAPSATR